MLLLLLLLLEEHDNSFVPVLPPIILERSGQMDPFDRRHFGLSNEEWHIPLRFTTDTC